MELLSALHDSSIAPQLFPSATKQRCEPSGPSRMADRESITVKYLPLVRTIALNMRSGLPGHVELDDLISAGALGLLDAIDRFSSARGVQFATYAQFRIRGAILDSLRAADGASRSLRRKARDLELARIVLTAALGRTPTESELATQLNITLSQIQTLRRDLDQAQPAADYSLHRDARLEDGVEQLPARKEEGPLTHYLRGEDRTRLRVALATLPTRHRRVIELYYYEEASMREIGAEMGVVESRVSQIRSIAVANLRKQFSEPAAGY